MAPPGVLAAPLGFVWLSEHRTSSQPFGVCPAIGAPSVLAAPLRSVPPSERRASSWPLWCPSHHQSTECPHGPSGVCPAVRAPSVLVASWGLSCHLSAEHPHGPFGVCPAIGAPSVLATPLGSVPPSESQASSPPPRGPGRPVHSIPLCFLPGWFLPHPHPHP